MDEKLFERYPIKNPIEDVSKTSKWGIADFESAAMRIADLVEPVDEKTKCFAIKPAVDIIQSAFAAGRASAISDAVDAVEKLRLEVKFAERNRTVDKAIAAIKSLEDKNG